MHLVCRSVGLTVAIGRLGSCS